MAVVGSWPRMYCAHSTRPRSTRGLEIGSRLRPGFRAAPRSRTRLRTGSNPAMVIGVPKSALAGEFPPTSKRAACSKRTHQPIRPDKGPMYQSVDLKSPLKPNVISKKITIAATEIPSDACHILRRSARSQTSWSQYGENSQTVEQH